MAPKQTRGPRDLARKWVLNYNTILQLGLFCKRKGKWGEVLYIWMFIPLFQNLGLKNFWWEHLTHIFLSAFIPHRSLMILMIPSWAHLPEIHNWEFLPLPILSRGWGWGEQISGSFPLDGPSGQIENPDLHKSTDELGPLIINNRDKIEEAKRIQR